MQIDNFLQMNDWKIDKFLRVIFAIQISVLGLTLMDNLGLVIPLLREILSVIYLLFVPGVLILRILKIHRIGSIETLLYSVGLSITSIMFIGFIINLIYPLFGISNPISMVPLIITISIVVTILSVLSYLRDKTFSTSNFINFKELLSPIFLFLCLIPFLAIFGTYLMNWYGLNIILLLLIILICMVVILFAYNEIPNNLYPFTVFILSVSLLYHTSLISNYVTGWDIQNEYYLADLVIKNAYWNLNINYLANAMLSITILAPIFSLISKINLDLVFKMIYPILFSFVPVGLYNLFKKQTNDEIAFLACFLFISLFVFYTEMISLARQQIAEFFLVLWIMLMIDNKIENVKKSILFVLFGISLVLSHYGLSYLFMFSLIAVYILVFLDKKYNIQSNMQNWINIIFSNKNSIKNQSNAINENTNYRLISSTFVIFFITITLSWYMYISNSAPLTAIVGIGNNIASTITTEFLNSNSVQGLAVIQGQTQSILHSLSKYVQLMVQFFITIGLLSVLFNNNSTKFNKYYLAFVLVNFSMLIAAVTVPFFASALNTERLYQITLIFLAPLCIIGGITTLKIFFDSLKFLKIKKARDNSLKLLSIFFVIFFLFNTGFVYYIFNDESNSIALNATYDTGNFNQNELYGTEWLNKYDNNKTVIADDYRVLLMTRFNLPRASFSNFYKDNSSSGNIENYLSNYYHGIPVFFGTKNGVTNSIVVNKKQGTIFSYEYKNLNNFFFVENKIYDNNGSQIYSVV